MAYIAYALIRPWYYAIRKRYGTARVLEKSPHVNQEWTISYQFVECFREYRAESLRNTVTQLFKKFPTLYGTRRFLTVFTKARHWSQFWASCLQSPPPPSYFFDIYFKDYPPIYAWVIIWIYYYFLRNYKCYEFCYYQQTFTKFLKAC
jgi:hypothetical protein